MRRSPGSLFLLDQAASSSSPSPLTSGRARGGFVGRARVLCVLIWAVGLVFAAASLLSLQLREEDDEAYRLVQCSVRVNTFRRNDLLFNFVNHYSECPCVRDIAVVWSDLDNQPPRWLEDRRPRVFVERHSEDSLNNRFHALEEPTMPAIFSVDDDVIVSCEGLASMLLAWRASPDQMIGPAPRLISRDGRYLRWWHVWWNGRYNFVLTKIAVFHKKYLQAYYSPRLSQIRQHVDQHRNCEDIAMSFVVANATRGPPTWFRSLRYRDYGQSFAKHAGISSGVDHIAIREDCLRFYAQVFGYNPLLRYPAYHKTYDARLFFS